METENNKSNIIEISELNKWYGDFHALKNINMNVKEGEIIVVCGPSGSGKSTLIRCVNFLEKFQEGNIVVLNDISFSSMKTKLLQKSLNKLPIGKSVLFVTGEELDQNFNKALKNIPMHDLLPIQGANVYDILRRETLVLSKSSVEALVARLANKKEKAKIKKEKK